MKKLLLILSAILVSVTGWAATETEYNNWGYAHPYAYNLKSSYNANGDTLILSYMLNANALNDRTLNTYAIGVQIFFLNDNNSVVYTNTQGGINKTTNKNQPHIVKIAVKDINIANEYKNKPLRWMVRVWGPESRTLPKIVSSSTKKPVNAYGIAINSIATHPNFGKVYVSEASPSSTDNKNSLLQFDAATNYVNRIRKYQHFPAELMKGDTSYFSAALNQEPHRVKISEDGRIFVSCYHPTAGGVVLEYLGNNEFSSIIKPDIEANKINNNTKTSKDPAENSKYFRRVVGMDVQGSGENLKILVCWINPNDEWRGRIQDPNDRTTYRECYDATIECIEYQVGKAEKDGVLISKEQPLGQATGTYAKTVAEYTDYYTASHMPGLIYQGYQLGWNSGNRGFVDVVYGANDIIWMKIDYAASYTRVGRIVAFKDGAVLKTNYMTEDATGEGYYGGNGIFYDAENDIIITGAGAGKIKMYTINSSTGVLTEKSAWQLTENTTSGDKRIGHWVTAFAKDHANNLYAITQKEWTAGESYTANVLTIAMPYSGDGKRETLAQETITISDPIPNIYATNLRYEAVEGAPKYKFSFNVNTKPKYAEIRFYKSYESMKKSLSIVNADNFKGGKDNRDADLYCYYPITSGLKCGKIEVEFDMVGGVINNKLLTDPKLPRGQLYWSVYVETDKSAVFAPVYRQPLTGTDAHYRLHATVNNYPETDQFGAVYAAQEDKRDANNKRSSLMIYEINDNGSDVHDLNNTTRYQKTHEYLYATDSDHNKAFPRRMTVAPDGLLYIAHQGDENQNGSSEVAKWKYGGIYTWNPNDSVNANGKIKLSLFSYNEIGTSSAVVLHPFVNGNDTTWNLYATNTYNEYVTHGQSYDTVAAASINKFGWNGFVEYVKDKNVNWETWVGSNTANYSLGRGDESGNVSLAATDYGMWLCQHREHNVKVKKNIKEPYADNKGAYVLSFVPYGKYSNSSYAYGPRTWRSCTTDGGRVVTNSSVTTKNEAISDNSQTETAPLQSTPGGGMTYKKVKISDTKFNEYLYIVNHDGDIVQWKIEWADNNTRPRMYIDSLKILKTPTETKGVLRVEPTKDGGVTTDWTTAAITSMCFDFAGNLVTTTGVSYFDNNQLQNEASELAPEGGQNIIIYTMPYDRTNAREIQAPKSNIFIPERTAYLEDRTEMNLLLQPYVENTIPCYLDIFRPMPNTSFSTICLPFDLDMKQLTTEALKDAEVKRYTGLQLSDIGGEKMLELVFEDVPINGEGKQILEANTPYIIQPKVRIPGIIQLQEPIQFVTINEQSVVKETQVEEYAITFKGVIPTQQIEVNQPLTLLLVAENRLAEMVPDAGFTNQGKIHGFRGYFELNKPLNGIGARITPKQSVSTSTTIIVDGKRVNIEKYLREGRVYIRVGDSLYTMDGQLVK